MLKIISEKDLNTVSRIQLFFLRKVVRQSDTDVTSFSMQFRLTKHSPSLRKASCSNPRPIFSNCMQNDITLVRHCLTSFRKKNNCILLSNNINSFLFFSDHLILHFEPSGTRDEGNCLLVNLRRFRVMHRFDPLIR